MKTHKLPLTKRCELLSIARSSAYYQSTQDPSRGDVLMRAMDEIHLRLPFYGSRRICDELAEEGQVANRKCVQRLMRRMGMNTLYPKPNTSRARQPGVVRGHHLHPDAQRLSLPRGHHGLAQPQSAELAHLQHARYRLLRGGP